jgi:hypothetical protein
VGDRLGHQHLGQLPRSRNWQQVVNFIASGASVEAVAAETSKAAEGQMIDASVDPAVMRSVYLLAKVPQAARAADFWEALGLLGVDVGAKPSLEEILCGISSAVDNHVDRVGGRTDLGEMAQLSLVEALRSAVAPKIGGLIESGPEQAQEALASLATQTQFGALARDFFARLSERQLDYFLSRVMGQHVGEAQRFLSVREHRSFDDALTQHCRETARIVEIYARDWFSKQTYEGGISEAKAGRFAETAFDKIRRELRIRRGAP